MNDGLGALKSINVRTQWPDEAKDFTPWLAQEENIVLLGEALGIELEVENTEVDVGPYSADILALDTATGDFVVIENQLEKTNHDHLGKAMTYAAGLDASAVVWIAAKFTEEHHKVLDWLNDNSSEDVSFFGVRLELWQIEDSQPAVHFNVISRPADFARKSTITKASAALTETKKLQLEWWTAFREALLERGVVTSAMKPRPQYWYNVALGRSGIKLSNIANTEADKLGVRVYLRGRNSGDLALAQLLDQKEAIESEIGEPLIWNPNPDARDKVIRITIEANLAMRGNWASYLDWMVDMTSRFRSAFVPRIKQLDFERPTNEESESSS